MLRRLAQDPNIMQKRLGDGYYEQQQIRDQIMALTGRYYLGDYQDNDRQYKALMDAGIHNGKRLNLRPGIALSAAQIAQLTDDIVWLVERDVTLADGSTQTVLAPKVYTRQGIEKIDGTSSLIAAKETNIHLSGNLNNQGNIVGHDRLNIHANNLTNQNGGNLQGAIVQINTKANLDNLGSRIHADKAMQLTVAGNLNNKSTTYHNEAQQGQSNGNRTGITQIAHISVGDELKGQTDNQGNPLITFSANVGSDTTFKAGILSNQGGSSILNSKGNVNFDAINTGYQTNAIGDSHNYHKQSETKDIGSQITGVNDIIIQAGNNVTGTATQINSDAGIVGIKASNDITFKEGRHTQNLSTAVKTTNKGWFRKKTTQDNHDMQSDTAIKTNIGGNKIIMDAGHDISLTAVDAISDHGTSLKAGNDVSILAAKNRYTQSSRHREKKSGIFGTGGMGFTIGKQQKNDDNSQSAITHTSSNIGTIDGNTIIQAGNHYQQTGSDVIAGMGEDSSKDIVSGERGNVVIKAKDIDIDNSMDVYSNQSEQQFKQSGLTVSVSNSLIDTSKSIKNLINAADNTDNKRMQSMAAVSAALKTKALYQQGKQAFGALKSGDLKNVGNTRIQATLGKQQSHSNSSNSQEVNQGSTITGNTLTLIATGNGKNSNINVNGSDINIANGAYIQSDNNFNINGVVQKQSSQNSNNSKGFGIGAYASIGAESTSAGMTAHANKGWGHANGKSENYANSHINIGGTTTLNISGNVTADAGSLTTNHLTGEVKGDVIGISRQDTHSYNSKQKHIGSSIDIDLLNAGAGSNLSTNGSKTNLNADYAAVKEQAGFFSQSSDLIVGGKGKFTGAAFTTATDKDNQTVFKQGIETKDIQNHSRYEGKAIAAGISLGQTNGKAQVGRDGIGYGHDGDSQTSTTYAAVTGMAGKLNVTTANKDSLNESLDNGFDADRVNRELNDQVAITQAFGKEAPRAVAEFAEARTRQIILNDNLTEKEKQEEIAKWKEGGVYRVSMHSVVSALGTGTIEGTLAGGSIAAVAAPTINKLESKLADKLIEQGMSPTAAKNTAKGITSLSLIGAGQASGLDTASTATAVNVDMNNRQLHPELGEYWLVEQLYKKQGKNKKWTRGQIANALRSADFKKGDFTEDDDSNTVVNLSNGEPKNYIDYHNGAKWQHTGGGLILPVDRNIDPILAGWINQTLSNDDTFKSYKYTWDIQNLKGNKPLPSILTPEQPKPTASTKPISQGKNSAKIVTKQELESRNQAVKNGADMRDGGIIQTASDQAVNEKVLPVVQTGTGAIEVITGVAACDSVVGCPLGTVLITNGLDNVATGRENYNKKSSEQVPSVALDNLGVSKGTAVKVKLVADLGSGASVANISKASKTVKASTATKAERINDFGDYVLPTGRQSLDPTRTSFSQATVSYQKNGRPYNYDTIVADMKAKNGWIGDPVDVVNMPDHAPTSMDNTRVLAAREAGVKVEANVHNYSDPLTLEQAKRFEYNGVKPTTWGEAIELRIKKQETQRGVPKGWSKKYPNGSIYDPEVIK